MSFGFFVDISCYNYLVFENRLSIKVSCEYLLLKAHCVFNNVLFMCSLIMINSIHVYT